MALTHGKDSAMAQSPCGDQTTAQSLVSRLAGQVRHPKTEPRLGPSPPFEKLIFHPIFWGVCSRCNEMWGPQGGFH